MLSRPIPPEVIRAIQAHFHEVILATGGELITRHQLQLPELTELRAGDEQSAAWFPIPGMYGGFHYWFEGDGHDAKLIAESWSRIVGGSGRRHEITASGSKLVDEGFI